MSRWDLGRYGVERRCTCKKSNRWAECAGGSGWHLVDTADDLPAAIRSMSEINRLTSVEHRVIDRPTGATMAA